MQHYRKNIQSKKTPAISVCVPMYNSARFIGECIDSVLAQTFQDFELIIADDGSTDGSCNIIENYTDPRIRLIRNRHDFIATKNRMLDEAQGKYIAFIDSDDRMLPDRLTTQYEYLEAHPEIDVLGGGVWTFGNGAHTALPGVTGRAITLDEMIEGNQIFNPTVMLRRDRMVSQNIRYPEEYIYANDYALWMCMLLKGMHLENLNKILTEYRYSPNQISSKHQKEQAHYASLIKEEAIRIKTNGFKEEATNLEELEVPVTGNKLTLIIPFLNEKDEVKNTVASAREFAGNNVDIITINDHSTDGYNYPADLEPYNVTYVYNKERMGVAASRDLGVKLCTTPYFLLLDAHMRFYESEWPERIVTLLEDNDRCVLCCQTKPLYKKNGQVFDMPGAMPSFGAQIPFIKGHYLPDIKWNNYEKTPNQPIEPISAILGAGYACSKRYWNYLHGLEGLLYYGSDEAYISLKTWMEGGQCLLLKDVIIGHLYRSHSPFQHINDAEVSNYLLIAYLLFPQSWRCMAFATALINNKYNYEVACRLIKKEEAHWKELRSYYHSIFTIKFKDTIFIHRQANRQQVNKHLAKAERLPEVAYYLRNNEPIEYGLMEGKMGNIIWFCHYALYSKNDQWEDIAYSLWEKVSNAIKAEKIPANFCHGLAGIGWGIIYLYEHGFIEDYPSEILTSIDEQISWCDPSKIKETNLSTGCGGIIAYTVVRIRLALKLNQQIPWDTSFLHKLKEATKKIEDKAEQLIETSYAMQLETLIKEGIDHDDFNTELHDWMVFREHLPEDSRYWSSELNKNTLSSTLHCMLLQTNN